jgi:3-oxoacyl-[acyl-carrier-protein] synthase III
LTLLAIHSDSVYLPPLQRAADMVAEAGVDTTGYTGWATVPVAGEDDHPSTMNVKALREALRLADIGAADLSLVLSGGISRDYPPSWSIATEAMRLCGATDRCIGIDLTCGCLGGLVGLEFASAWLSSRGGGYAAIICSERWSWTVNRADPASRPFWGIGDGAAATIVGFGTDRPVLAEFVGAEYCSNSELNAHALIRYGGTRYPAAPQGHHPHERAVSERVSRDVREIYQKGYGTALGRVRTRFGAVPQRLVCNQITPALVNDIGELAGVDAGAVVRTGERIGHIGSADLQIGIGRLLEDGPIDTPAVVAASTPYAFGAGLLVAPEAPRDRP